MLSRNVWTEETKREIQSPDATHWVNSNDNTEQYSINHKRLADSMRIKIFSQIGLI